MARPIVQKTNKKVQHIGLLSIYDKKSLAKLAGSKERIE